MREEEEIMRRKKGQGIDGKNMGEEDEGMSRKKGQSRDGKKMGEEDEGMSRKKGQSRDGKKMGEEGDCKQSLNSVYFIPNKSQDIILYLYVNNRRKIIVIDNWHSCLFFTNFFYILIYQD